MQIGTGIVSFFLQHGKWGRTVTKVAAGWMLAGALFLLCGSTQCAYGDTFTFSMSWSGPYGPGTAFLTATDVGANTWIVTAMNGTQNGLPVSLIASGGYGSDDNSIFPFPYTGVQLDSHGLSFSAGGLDYKLFAYTLPGNTNTYTECVSNVAITCIGSDVNKGAAVSSLSITPEPASIALVGTL